MSEESVTVHPSPEALAEAVAAELLIALTEAQAAGAVPAIVLTGGSVADGIHRAVAASPGRDGVDWSSVQVWWGDERFVRLDDGDRNERQARTALLDGLPLHPAHVHPMPADDGSQSAEQAAARYADELAAAAGDGSPVFDVLMLGVGEDGHVASLFPDHPGLAASGVAVAVRDSPKPPPVRVSLTFEALNRAREVWFVAAGGGKAWAVAQARAGGNVSEIPARAVRGIERTRWLLDEAAAAQLTAHPTGG
ncbi:MAG: 6-phosphogluconolactonase [Nocardioidaceae bacterium]|jgi:6-phosphogluconolactonase|nr:6-phosphogluconolactonase [Nocardioidaceae bacterium]